MILQEDPTNQFNNFSYQLQRIDGNYQRNEQNLSVGHANE
jgi:hypothetical protein